MKNRGRGGSCTPWFLTQLRNFTIAGHSAIVPAPTSRCVEMFTWATARKQNRSFPQKLRRKSTWYKRKPWCPGIMKGSACHNNFSTFNPEYSHPSHLSVIATNNPNAQTSHCYPFFHHLLPLPRIHQEDICSLHVIRADHPTVRATFVYT